MKRAPFTSSSALLLALLLATGLLMAGCDLIKPGDGDDAKERVTVMTRNLYLGGDLFGLLEAEGPEEALQEATALFAAVLASNFPERAGALAAEIEAADPALIGVQEATLYRTQQPSDFLQGNTTPNAEDVLFDFLQILQDSLMARGLEYRVASTVVNLDEELPVASQPGTFIDVRLTDRDVILARADVQTSREVAANYTAAVEVEIAGAPITFLRGYQRVRAVVGDARFTFVNTHLEVGGDAAPVQVAQATELLSTLAGIGGPIVLVGDFNSAADGSTTASYGLLTQAYTDAFATVRPDDPGFTCCQEADLRNEASLLDERIDLVLYRGAVRALEAEVVGEAPSDKTPSGLWPSDHAGVVATLRIGG